MNSSSDLPHDKIHAPPTLSSSVVTVTLPSALFWALDLSLDVQLQLAEELDSRPEDRHFPVHGHVVEESPEAARGEEPSHDDVTT